MRTDNENSWEKLEAFLKEREAETQREMEKIRAERRERLLAEFIDEVWDKQGVLQDGDGKIYEE